MPRVSDRKFEKTLLIQVVAVWKLGAECLGDGGYTWRKCSSRSLSLKQNAV